ncbi:hypothetical protein FRC11_000356 [Ceratobasidium sp. 423]|nr:hypothetical protein FRC11_000356 [Ceratobasidium sp. 423]
MEHNEDEQPNESVYGRRKRILPFVRDTSRIQGQKKHQFAPILVPVPAPSESTRGRGYGRGRGRDRGRGRGQGKYRGGGGVSLHPPTPELPQLREVNPWSQLDDLREHTPQPTTPEPSTPPQTNFDAHPGPSSGRQLPGRAEFKVTRQKLDEWAPGPSVLGPQPPIRPFQNSQRPRKRFRPGKNGKGKSNGQHNTVGTNTFSAERPIDRQAPQETAVSLRDDDDCPPAKRPRVKEEDASPSRVSLSAIAQGKLVKFEIEDDAVIDLLREKPTSGTKFVSYDDHPLCRFNCGEHPSQVRKHRKVLKAQEVQVLRDQGREVLAAFIRDDGIAIDWVVPTKSDTGASTSRSMSSIVILEDLEPNPPLPSEDASIPTPPPPNRPLPSHLNPLVVSADKSGSRRSSTPTTTEVAYREVSIPPRHLPRDGNTRKLEIWALEQMRLLEAELGPVILPPPELVGIGEYITGQKLPEGVHPHIKIRYKRTVRVHQSSVEPNTRSEETFSLAELMGESPTVSAEHPSPSSPPAPLPAPLPPSASVRVPSSPPAPLPPIDPAEPTMPLITHLETAYSSSAPSSPLPIKNEVDELADNPPSLPASPKLARPIGENIHTPIPDIEPLSENVTIEPQVVPNEEHPQSIPNDSGGGLDELQRLRRDLELSKLEAERKHRELEQRILELSQKRSETHTPTPIPNTEQPSTIRIADEGKSNILPLRRGKYDKTRRLLAASDSTILHVSWLGVMQLVDRDSRRIVATGFGSDAPSNISVEDACSLSPSSTALALSGGESQLAMVTLGEV